MGKTSVDAKRHMRALGELFRESRTVSDEVVRAFFDAYEHRKYLKQSLRRMMSQGIVRRNASSYVLTRFGVRFFQKQKAQESFSPDLWDGKWRIISVDVREKYCDRRYRLRALLKEFNFFPLQKSVWVCPAHLYEKLWKLIVDERLHAYCKVMLVQIIEGDKNLRKYFKLSQK